MRKLLRDEVRQIVAGSFEIDGAPTIFKHDRSSTLVFMHEQTHRDNLNNTLFGYWLRRLHHFEDAPAWPALTPPLQVAEEAITGAWNTLEGAAVFTEYLHIHMGYVDVSEKDWLASLPRDYLLAFSVYYRALEWFLKHGAILKSGPPPGRRFSFRRYGPWPMLSLNVYWTVRCSNSRHRPGGSRTYTEYSPDAKQMPPYPDT